MVSSTRQITIPHHSDTPTQIGAEQTHIINSYAEAQKGNIIGVTQPSQSHVSSRRARIWKKLGPTETCLQKLAGTKRDLSLEIIGDKETSPKKSKCLIFDAEDSFHLPTAEAGYQPRRAP